MGMQNESQKERKLMQISAQSGYYKLILTHKKFVSKIYIYQGSCTLRPVDFNMDLDSFNKGFKQLSDCNK